jgi:hypothetical protein
MASRLWTVARFPAGMWSAGGKPSDSDYSLCEVYQVPAESAEKATKKAQSVRSRLVKKGSPLPTQAAPYKSD